MKLLILVLILTGITFIQYARANPFDLYMNQMSADGTGYQNRQLSVPNSGAGVDGMLIYSGTNSLPQIATFASGCSITFGVFNCTGTGQVNSDWNASSGLAQILNKPTSLSAFTNDPGYITSSALSPYATTSALTSGLAGKYNNPVGTTAQYLRGDGSLATFPSIPAAQVNSDWNSVSGVSHILNKPTVKKTQCIRATTSAGGAYTYNYPSSYSVAPVIQVSVEDNTTDTVNHKITAVSTTATSIQLARTAAVTILGISVLGVASNVATVVDVCAIEQ